MRAASISGALRLPRGGQRRHRESLNNFQFRGILSQLESHQKIACCMSERVEKPRSPAASPGTSSPAATRGGAQTIAIMHGFWWSQTQSNTRSGWSCHGRAATSVSFNRVTAGTSRL